MPAAGFNSPSILFLSTWDQSERDFMGKLLKEIRHKPYTRFVEPCAGAFVMPGVARVLGGWEAEQMECSDVSLFSSILGTMFAGRTHEELEVRVDGELHPLTGDAVDDAAHLLFTQAWLRFQRMPDNIYWDELRKDLDYRRGWHIAAIRDYVARLQDRFGGMDYRPLDIWDHLEEVADDPNTVVSINPPTYLMGFEKFYDTKGRLEWAEPDYKPFDAATDIQLLIDSMEGSNALVLCQQQQVPGGASSRPVHARHLAPGQNVYIISNRPDEVEAITGMSAVPRGGPVSEAMDVDVIPRDYEITPDSVVAVSTVEQKHTRYYRDLFMHKLGRKQAAAEFAVYVDGYLVGVAGYDTQALDRPFNDKWFDALILTYAVGAPHNDYRLTRLVTMMALCRSTVDLVVGAWAAARAKRMVTVEMTRHPEAKGLRGIMKLAERQKDKVHGNKLVYATDIVNITPVEHMKTWVAKERKSREDRLKSLG